MFGARGNPQAGNLFGIIGSLQKQAGVELHVTQGLEQACSVANYSFRLPSYGEYTSLAACKL